MDYLETRELRYFLAVAEEQHFGRAAELLGMAQPPLSRAIRQLESRLGVRLFDRDRRGARLTEAGRVLAREATRVLEAVAAAQRRTRRAANPETPIVLATKAGASHDLLQRLLATLGGKPELPAVKVLLCEVGEQARLLREGQADLAIMHRPVDDLVGLDTADLYTESQVAIVPATHPLADRELLTLAEIQDIPDLPIARWPKIDGSYPEGSGPEVHTQSQIAHLVALGKTLLIIPASSRAWQWPAHVAVPVIDAPDITTVLAWPQERHDADISTVVRIATMLPIVSERSVKPLREGRPHA